MTSRLVSNPGGRGLTRQERIGNEVEYKDTGCDLHHACLTCPFARCKYDEIPAFYREREKRVMAK